MTVDMTAYASDLDAEIANPTGGKKGKTFFGMDKDTSTATIRFMAYDPNNSVLVHNRYAEPKRGVTAVQMPCLKQYGKDCPYCALGNAELTAQGILNKKVFLFPVYWHEQECQTLFAYTTTGWSPLPSMHAAVMMRLRGKVPVDTYDFTLTKKAVTGKSMTQTTATHCDPSDAPEAMKELTVWTREECRQKYLETMLAFAKKARENAAPDMNQSLSDDIGDIKLG